MPSRLKGGGIVTVGSSATRERSTATFRLLRVQDEVAVASHLEGAPLKDFFARDPILVVVDEESRSLAYEAVITDVRLPDTLSFRVNGPPRARPKREYVRIDDFLCVECTVRKGDEKAVLETYKQRTPRKPPIHLAAPTWFTHKDERNVLAEVEKEILKVLVSMDLKIDAIVKFLSEGNRGALMSFTPRWVNLSGSGIRFTMNDPVQAGDFLEIRLFLPDAGGVPVNILGVVIRAERSARGSEQGIEVAANYHYIEEEDRDRLIRYIFSRQRESIRSGMERKGGAKDVE
ncbi:MAG: PilZ domain-containing protein [Deltaproteobacteria bacterium]|nr:PilZ domain-containing protein [Deltaproteobacteria bacterium]